MEIFLKALLKSQGKALQCPSESFLLPPAAFSRMGEGGVGEKWEGGGETNVVLPFPESECCWFKQSSSGSF